MPDRYRSAAARDLVVAVRRAGGTVERRGRSGRLVVTGPAGAVTISEPNGEPRRGRAPQDPIRLIEEKTGLRLTTA